MEGISVTSKDIGRRVRLKLMGRPDAIGVIADSIGCGACKRGCVSVRWGEGTSYCYADRLQWADGDLI